MRLSYSHFGTLTDTFTNVEKVWGAFKAGGAIPVGATTKLDFAAAAAGYQVIVGTAGTEHICRGIYTGNGGTGAIPSSPFDGRAAVSGDVIECLLFGVTEALVNGSGGGANSITAGETLQMAAAGKLIRGNNSGITGGPAAGAPIPGVRYAFGSMEASTADASNIVSVAVL